MRITYGSYQFESNCVAMEMSITPVRDPRGVLRYRDKEVRLSGALRADTQANFKTIIEQFEAAMSLDYQDFKLLHDDGSSSAHTMINAETYGGVRAGPIRWLNKTAAEYATVRHFEVTLMARYIASNIPLISEYRETITVQGTGVGPTIYTPCLDGTVHSQIVYPVIPIVVVQQGTAKGSIDYPKFPAPIMSIDFQQHPQSQQTRIKPRKQGTVPTDYGIAWTYVFEYVKQTSGLPVDWFPGRA